MKEFIQEADPFHSLPIVTPVEWMLVISKYTCTTAQTFALQKMFKVMKEKLCKVGLQRGQLLSMML